jgi:hypothetical protein
LTEGLCRRDSKLAVVLVPLMTLKVAVPALCALALGLAAAPLALAQTSPSSSKVKVATTGNRSELVQTVPITKRPSVSPRVVMSMAPRALPSLQTGDQLEVSAEVEVTTDCRTLSSQCVGQPYEFNPRIGAMLVLAASPGTASGFVLVPRQEVVCRQKLPDRQHHCVIVLQPPALQVDLGALPCGPGSCHVNLVIDTYQRHGSPKRNVLLIGANNRNGKVKQDKGRINAIRTRPGVPPVVPPPPPTGTGQVGTSERLAAGVPLDPPSEAVIYSLQLDGLTDGEQLAVKAGVTTDVSLLPHNVNVSSRVVLADDPLSTDPGVIGAQVSKLDGEITENNGFNCTHRTTPCASTKLGVVEIRANADVPLYVNVVVNIARIGGSSPPGTFLPVTEAGGLEITRYPASVKG